MLKDAYLLATGRQAPNMLNVARGFYGEAPKVKQPSSQEMLDLGKQFGLTEEEIQKYSQRAKEKQI